MRVEPNVPIWDVKTSGIGVMIVRLVLVRPAGKDLEGRGGWVGGWVGGWAGGC